MNVLLSTAGHIGPDYYRIREPARAVEESGHGVSVTVQRGLSTTVRPSSDGGQPEVVDVDAQGADVVVLQLPKTAEMLQCIRLLQAQGVAVVVEIDDLLSAVPFGHPAHNMLVRKGMGRRALECSREADFVTTSTPLLLEEYAPRGRGAVVPNAIPRRIAELSPAYDRDPEIVTVGWTGTVLGHPYDLQEMGSGLQQALAATRGSSRFVILGQRADAQQRMALPEQPGELPWIPDVDQYTRTVGEIFDVGVAPLRDDRFNTAKSWLKALEFAARGVYFVRSPSAEYERLGLGMRAKSPKDWSKWITLAIRDAERRREQAVRARETVLAEHLTEHTVDGWLSSWQQAIDNRARSRRKGA
jgi:hypothetical protein